MINQCATNRVRGFTLVELVSTIVIAGILGAVALPRMFDSQAFSERGYIDEVASAIRYAQKISIASRCDVSIVISAGGYVANQRDTLIDCTNPAIGWGTPIRRSDGSNLAGTAPQGISISPATTIDFNNVGGVSNGNPPVMSVGPFTLTVDQVTGLVTVTP